MPVISYCEIPPELTEDHHLSEYSPDCYVRYTVHPLKSRVGFDDDFSIDDWIITMYPELEDKEVLIHIDY